MVVSLWNNMKNKVVSYFRKVPFFLLSLVILSASLLFYNLSLPSIFFLVAVVLRIVITFDKKIIISAIVCACVVTIAYFLENENYRNCQQTEITGSTLIVQMDTIKIRDNQLCFIGKLPDKTKIMCFKRFINSSEKFRWQKIAKPILLKVKGKVEFPEKKRNLNGFDYQKYLRSKKIALILKIENYTVHRHRISSVFEALSWLRFKAIKRTRKNIPTPARYYIACLLFSYSEEEFADVLARFRKLGIIHFFCLSGMHVMFFLTLFRFLLLRSGVSLETTLGLQILMSFVYLGLAGFATSLLRGLFQKNIEFINERYNLGFNKQDCFFFSLFFGILINPYLMETVSGQLSYGFAFTITFWNPIRKKIKSALEQNLLFSAGITITLLPLLLWHFFEWNPLSLVLTIFLGLLFEKFLYATLVFIFCFPIPFMLTIVNIMVQAINNFLFFVEKLFPINWCLGKPSLMLMLVLWFLIFSALCFFEGKRTKSVLISCFLLILTLWLVNHPFNGLVMMIDVGQGDSILIEEPFNRKVSLIDTGGKLSFGKSVRKSNAEQTLIPVLKSRGIRVIDSLFITHADHDHCGDLEILAKEVEIKKIYLPDGSEKRKGLCYKLARLASRGVKIERVLAPQKLADFFLLAPTKTGNGENNDSLVLFRKICDKKFLFTGDLEEVGEKELGFSYFNLQVDVLKVGHHGSRFSTSQKFLQLLQPTDALISVGKNNQFLHPHEETLTRLKNQKIYRTDQHGAIYYEWFFLKNRLGKVQTVK